MLGMLRSAGMRLEDVEVKLATMGGVVEQQMSDAIQAFQAGEAVLAEAVVDRDTEVDEIEREIEAGAYRILEQGRLSGEPFRRAMSAIRVAAEMERIGDLAKNVANRTVVLSKLDFGDAPGTTKTVITRMGQRTLGQLSESLDCLSRRNATAARAIRDADDQIDDLYNSIFRELLVDMSQYGAGVVVGTHLVFIAKNFERIGDHATNIAERVHFSVTGNDIDGERPKSDVTSSEVVSV